VHKKSPFPAIGSQKRGHLCPEIVVSIRFPAGPRKLPARFPKPRKQKNPVQHDSPRVKPDICARSNFLSAEKHHNIIVVMRKTYHPFKALSINIF
jgi:hypothetical protein